MAERVIHLSHDVHAKVKDHCAQLGVGMKQWAEQVLLQAVEGSMDSGKAITAVSKKRLPDEVEETGGGYGTKPWEQPPFWERDSRDETKEEAQEVKLGALEVESEGEGARAGESEPEATAREDEAERETDGVSGMG